MNKSKGFTVIEIIFVIIIALVSGFFITQQREQIESTSRDNQRKTAINAIYYSLENSYKKENVEYPLEIKDDTLKTIDPEILKDPAGNKIGSAESTYKYEPSDCSETGCKSYRLSTLLEREDEYVKTNATK